MSANYDEDAGVVLLSINNENLTFTMLPCPGGSKTLPIFDKKLTT